MRRSLYLNVILASSPGSIRGTGPSPVSDKVLSRSHRCRVITLGSAHVGMLPLSTNTFVYKCISSKQLEIGGYHLTSPHFEFIY